ncbi:MAG: SRPBCC family protein, partial [Nitrososphaeraceae archaeon]
PKVEGKMKFSFFKTDSEYRQMDYFPEGTITEFIPNKRLSYSWHEPNIPDFPNTVVTWELERIENNKTRLNLLHTGFKSDETAKKHNEGWSHFLTGLKKYCEKRNKQS